MNIFVLLSHSLEESLLPYLLSAGLNKDQIGTLPSKDAISNTKINPIISTIETLPPSKEHRIYFIGALSEEIKWAKDALPALATNIELVPIGLMQSRSDLETLEQAGAWFVAQTADDVLALIQAPKLDASISIIVLAYNEEATILDAALEARRFASLYFSDFEIIVIDDGSIDDTANRLLTSSQDHLFIIQHPRNLGMGASMRDGYLAARKEYIVALPGDRQVRPLSLAKFLPHLTAESVVLSHYDIPHSGKERELFSLGFRFLVQQVAGLKVDFAGAYIFPRQQLKQIDLLTLSANTFLFSFQLLQQFKNKGCSFSEVTIRSFSRTAGTSRVFSVNRIATIFKEIGAYTLKSRLRG